MSENKPLLRGASIWLRALEEEDLDHQWQVVNNSDVAQFTSYQAPQSRLDVQVWHDTIVRGGGDRKYFFVISPLGSTDFIGLISLFNFESRIGGPELGIALNDPQRWGKGLGTDALNAMLDFAFGSLPINRIWLTTGAENERAQRSFKKAGFSVEGRIRKHILRHGRWEDSLLMSILRSDWEQLDRLRSWDYT
jgi:RimJ/RimL family protein N-acetyltransferase